MTTIRKQHGHYLEDFRPGQLLRHKGGKTVTEGLFALFTDFAMTANPLAKNARYARAYGFEGLVVPPGLVMGIVFSQSVEDVSENARANLEYIDMRFGVPVYIGDTGFHALPITKEPGLDEVMRLYRNLPEPYRRTVLSMIRAIAATLTGESEA